MPEGEFTKTGEVTIEAGLTADGDLAWRSGYTGLDAMSTIGLLVVVATRLILRTVSVATEGESPDA